MKKKNIYTLDFYKKHDAKAMSFQGNEIVLGKYEDLTIEPINSYDEAERLLSIIDFSIDENPCSEENNYPVSSLVLYSLEDEKTEGDDESGFFWSLKRFPEYLFRSVTLISFESVGEKDINERVNKLHKKLANSIYKDLECFCFGTFGAYSLCIITRSKRISTLVDFVNSLSKLMLEYEEDDKVFSSYTLLSYFNKQTDDANLTKMLGEDDESEYIANIQITYTNGYAAEDFLAEFKKRVGEEIIIYNTLGEFDICIHIPVNKLPVSIYLENGILNSYNNFYKSHILQSSTRISKKENTSNFQEKENFNLDSSKKYKETSEYVKSVFEEINFSLQKLYSSQDNDQKSFPTNLKRMFNIVNVDFRRAFSLAPKSYYAADLRHIFMVSIEYAKNLFENSNGDSAESDYYTICDTAKIITDAAYNMIQANDYTVIEPYSFLYNSSICQSIKQSYLGFIKLLLISFYENCSINQSEIVPVVIFDPKLNVMKSDIYNPSNSTNLKKNTRIVSFRLPYDAIYNAMFYLPLLVHELMHYFCPLDRNSRNKILLKVYLKVYFIYMTSCLCNSNTRNNMSNSFLDKFTNSWIDENFYSIISRIESADIIDFNDISMDFSRNLEEMFNQAFSKYNNSNEVSYLFSFYNDFLKNLVGCISNGESTGQTSNGILKNIIDELKDMSEPMLRQKIILKGKNKEAIEVLNSLSQGIKEIISDIMMVHCCELRLEAYFAVLIISMFNLDIKKIDTTQQIIRLGYMVHHYGFSFKGSFIFREDMKKSIRNIVLHINPSCSKNCADLDFYFSIIETALNDFRLYHIFYISDIDNIVDCYGFSNYSSKDGKHSDKDIRNSLNSLFQIITRIKNTYIFFGMEQHYDPTAIFAPKSTVNIMRMLNEQLGLNDINKFYVEKQSSKEPFTDFSNIYQHTNISTDNNSNPFPLTLTLNDLGIERSLQQVRKILTDNDDEQLWYRGQMDARWKVSPSLLRAGGNFRNRLVDAYEQFRAQSCESLEIHTNIDSDSDWIAFMQHYFVPTHFLDWSEQPLTSLYFALENYFDNPCKFEKAYIPPCGKGDYESAALYILNPVRMNMAFKGINGLPNISILRNEAKYRDYILTDRNEEGKVCFTNASDFLIQPSPPPSPDNYLPLAVITSQLSSRIKAQQGHFVIYNLVVNYDVSNVSSKIEDIVCLYNIQKEMYEQAIQKQEEFNPFLIKLIIPKDMKKEVANTIKSYGIRKSSFYPELMNIGSDISRFLFK